MQYKKLSEIAKIQSGLVLSRKEAKPNSAHPFKYKRLSLRSINDDGIVNKKTLDQYFTSEEIGKQFITAKDDIIIRLFPPFSPVMITNSLIGLVVPSQFAIIRLTSDVILPEFLHSYLSHRSILESMAIRENGSTLNGIKISGISEIKIPLIAIDNQKSIAGYREMYVKQKQLYYELMQQYDLKMNAVINRAIGGK